MELFPDRSHIRLKSHVDGLFLSAEEDGWGVSLAARRASINTAWQVHRVQRDGKSYVLLHSAAYGRYLVLWPQPGRHRLTLGVYMSSGQEDVLWEAIRAGTDGMVRLRHGRHKLYLNAGADQGTGRRWELWTVELIPPRPVPPVLPPASLVSSPSPSPWDIWCVRIATMKLLLWLLNTTVPSY